MRIITDKNVDQLMNMCYSKNINKLLNQPERITQFVIQDYVKNVNAINLSNEPSESDKRAPQEEIKYQNLEDFPSKDTPEPEGGVPVPKWEDEAPNLDWGEEVHNPEWGDVALSERTRQDDLIKQQGELLKTHGEILKMRESSTTNTPLPLAEQAQLADPVKEKLKILGERIRAERLQEVNVNAQQFVEPVFQDPELKQAYDNLPQDMRDKIRIKNFSQEKIEKLLNQLKQISPAATKFQPVPAEDITNILKVQEEKTKEKEESNDEGKAEPGSSQPTSEKEEATPTAGGEKKTISFNV
jgi:hypothetical protein